MTHEIALDGCAPEPLMAYLKALGIVRLVGEQKDPEVRVSWKKDVFWMRSTMDKEALVSFFLEEYCPTPIVAPWAGGSGFFKKDNQEAVRTLGNSAQARLRRYGGVIRAVQGILQRKNIGDKPDKETKQRLLRLYRSELPEEAVVWMDAVMALRDEGQGFAPLMGTGGNDSRLDFTQNFMQRLVLLGFNDGQVPEESKAWLCQALYLEPARLRDASVGQFSPGRAGGPNSTQGLEGDASDNPWDFLLMMEGALLLSGAVVRRMGANSGSGASFPFAVRPVASGYGSSAPGDEAASSGELWLPLWDRELGLRELQSLFSEGRAEVSGRPAANGADFARAVAGLGVDRGVTAFTRMAFLKRSGESHLATTLGRFGTRERDKTDLLGKMDAWVKCLKRACSGKGVPAHLSAALRNLDESVLGFCRYGGTGHFQAILVSLGFLEKALVASPRFRGEKGIRPFKGLSADWLDAANDGSAEFSIARALASMSASDAGTLRMNLEPVEVNKGQILWTDKVKSVVWGSANLTRNLSAVLQRRLLDGAMQAVRGNHPPLASGTGASLDEIAAFLAEETDEPKIEALLWGLLLVESKGIGKQTGQQQEFLLSRVYALLKLLFLPAPLVLEKKGERRHWRLARASEDGVSIAAEPAIPPLLKANRVGEACYIAARRLRISGLLPMPGPLDGRLRDEVWEEKYAQDRWGERLAAALLIPVRYDQVNQLIQLVCRDPSETAASLSRT